MSAMAIRTMISNIHRANFKSFQATKTITMIAISANQIGITVLHHLIVCSKRMMLLGRCSGSTDLILENYSST
jgi:hypothetical protein